MIAVVILTLTNSLTEYKCIAFYSEIISGITYGYIATFIKDERETLRELTSRGKHSSQKILSSLILLRCDFPARSDYFR
jgi:hypothetical protein